MKKIGIAAAAGLWLMGSIFYGEYDLVLKQKEKSLQQLSDSLSLQFSETTVLSYSNTTLDTMELVDNYAGGTITVSDDAIDLSQKGTYQILYTLTSEPDQYGQTATHKFIRTVKVTDNNGPVVEFENDSLSFFKGKNFKPTTNIKAVYDEVDGPLVQSDVLKCGTYTVQSNVKRNTAGSYEVTVKAMDFNGNLTVKSYTVEVKKKHYRNNSWDGTRLTPKRGTIMGPSGKETYYNLPMSGVIKIMRRMGNQDPYWIRDDGVKMLGDYVMVAANLSIRPRGSLIMTSLGMGIVCDTGAFAHRNPYQLDIAVDW